MGQTAVGFGERLGGDDQNFETRDVRLAAALMAVGIPPLGSEPVRIITHPHRSGSPKQFVLAPRSECGKYATAALVKAWRDGLAWIEKNPDHPFAYAMAAMQNHRDLLDYVKSAVPKVFLRSGRSIGMLPLDASSELEEKILGKLKP